MKLYPHEGRYCTDVMIESLVRDRSISWARIVNGTNKFVTVTSEEISIENVSQRETSGKSKVKTETCCKFVYQLCIYP